MILKRDSLFFRIAFWGTYRWDIPTQTSLCSVFWRCVLKAAVPVILAGFVLACIIVLILQDPSDFFITVGGAIGFAILLIAFILAIGSITEIPKAVTRLEESGKLPLFVVGALSVKRKFCPIIRIEN